MAKEAISYDKAELRAILRSFKAMDEEATQQAKQATSELAEYVPTHGVVVAGLTADINTQVMPMCRVDNRLPPMRRLLLPTVLRWQKCAHLPLRALVITLRDPEPAGA